MKIDMKVDDLGYHEHLYFFGEKALEKMILSLIEKFYGVKTKTEIQKILSISEVMKVETKSFQFKRR